MTHEINKEVFAPLPDAEAQTIMEWLVMDPAAWRAHAVATFGDHEAEHMWQAKALEHKAAYDAASDKRPRTEREGE